MVVAVEVTGLVVPVEVTEVGDVVVLAAVVAIVAVEAVVATVATVATVVKTGTLASILGLQRVSLSAQRALLTG